jgi:hypothetical protein
MCWRTKVEVLTFYLSIDKPEKHFQHKYKAKPYLNIEQK